MTMADASNEIWFTYAGSHLAGIVGASCNNGVGVCGVSPKVTDPP